MITEYKGDTFTIRMTRYSDPDRTNLARNAAIYLGKPDRDNIRRPLSIIKKGHVPEIFRGEHVEFEFIDVSKEVYDHLVTYTTRNMRAAGGNRALTSNDYTLPSDKVKDPLYVEQAVIGSMNQYKALLLNGETPQVARSAMPVAAKMNPFAYQFNFLTLMQSFFNQRIFQKGAQGNTFKVVKGMWALVHAQDPELWDVAFEYFGTPAVEWRTTGQKLKRMTVDCLLYELSNQADKDARAFDELRRLYGEEKSMWD
ncbi:FAD-dependent thymidylate synthase [Paenibacillus sp. OV219]|uniref:FAD-dependent thymidylate synthase n=1 Tax=Paenibacillus sp. OV219 TaxID=1884377 RepID=UPI0008CB2CD3|nr:FAD-dependent thymidylate synthase [Paenibacillus sp. OV219]SEN20843.1 Thymidylate synthase complementing protein [Paenibacillus sp. OV219]